jgi:hypothetical protein
MQEGLRSAVPAVLDGPNALNKTKLNKTKLN